MTDQARDSGDLAGEFQRWLLRSGARGMSRGVGDQIRSMFGGAGASADVWQTATADPPPPEAPECAWCPVCRAARLLRESGPGLATQVAAAGDALASLLSEAVSVAEQVVANAGRPAEPRADAQRGGAEDERERDGSKVISGVLETASHEPDDRG